MSSVHPRIIYQSASLRALQPVSTGTPQFDENWLQNSFLIIRTAPDRGH